MKNDMRTPLLSELMSDYVREEESQAALQAKKMGLTSKGFGRWADKSGEITHKTDNGKLVPVASDDLVAKLHRSAAKDKVAGHPQRPQTSPDQTYTSPGFPSAPPSSGDVGGKKPPSGFGTPTTDPKTGARSFPIEEPTEMPNSFYDVLSVSRMGRDRIHLNVLQAVEKHPDWVKTVVEKWTQDLKDPNVRPALKKKRQEDLKWIAHVIKTEKGKKEKAGGVGDPTRPTSGGDKSYSSLGIGSDDDFPSRPGKLDPSGDPPTKKAKRVRGRPGKGQYTQLGGGSVGGKKQQGVFSARNQDAVLATFRDEKDVQAYAVGTDSADRYGSYVGRRGDVKKKSTDNTGSQWLPKGYRDPKKKMTKAGDRPIAGSPIKDPRTGKNKWPPDLGDGPKNFFAHGDAYRESPVARDNDDKLRKRLGFPPAPYMVPVRDKPKTARRDRGGRKPR